MGAVAVYGRASVDQTDLHISVDRQVAICRELAGERWPDLPVVEFEDNNLSAADPDAVRPGYNALVTAIRAGMVQHVVVNEQSRLTRQPGQWEDLIVVLSRAGIDSITTVSKGEILVSAGNRLMSRILGAVDAEEAERTKVRVLAAHQFLAAQGRPGGGRPFGYRHGKDPDGRSALIIDPAQAAVVKRIAALVLAGHSVLSIAKTFDEEGVPTPRGATKWRPGAIRLIVTHPALAGYRTHHKKITARGTWLPILDEATWRQCVDRLTNTITVIGTDGTEHKVERRRPRPRSRLLSGGLAVCALCGSNLVASTSMRRNGPAVRAYACCRASGPNACCALSMSPADKIEQWVEASVLEALDGPEMAKRLRRAPGGEERQRFAAAVAIAEGKVHEAAALYGAGDIDKATWGTMHAAASGRLKSARAALDAVTVIGVTLPDHTRLRHEWPDLTLAQRRAVIDLVVDKVVISSAKPGTTAFDPNRISILWRA